jgi:hypothetical protein
MLQATRESGEKEEEVNMGQGFIDTKQELNVDRGTRPGKELLLPLFRLLLLVVVRPQFTRSQNYTRTHAHTHTRTCVRACVVCVYICLSHKHDRFRSWNRNCAACTSLFPHMCRAAQPLCGLGGHRLDFVWNVHRLRATRRKRDRRHCHSKYQ